MGFFDGLAGSLVSGVAGLFGSKMSSDAAEDINERNIALQREFAQHGIRWRVDDAKAAGIHPIYALGGSGATYSPVNAPHYDMGEAVADFGRNLGQDISRSARATQTFEERVGTRMAGLSVERAELENDLLRSRIAREQSAQVGPPGPSIIPDPIAGQVNLKELGVTHTDPGAPHKEVFQVPDFTYARTPTGLAVVPSKDVKERIEDQLVPEAMWSLRNVLIPPFSDVSTHTPDPSVYPPPPGTRWEWSTLHQEWRPVHVKQQYRRQRYKGFF